MSKLTNVSKILSQKIRQWEKYLMFSKFLKHHPAIAMTIFLISMCYLVKLNVKRIFHLLSIHCSSFNVTKNQVSPDFFKILVNIPTFSVAVINVLNISNLIHLSLMFVMFALCGNQTIDMQCKFTNE